MVKKGLLKKKKIRVPESQKLAQVEAEEILSAGLILMSFRRTTVHGQLSVHHHCLNCFMSSRKIPESLAPTRRHSRKLFPSPYMPRTNNVLRAY